ncbi:MULTISPECIES: molecular chaperone [unclassified Agrobacterium]|jgi:fimbrial chaperone protein|uniref:fimbrial biogenesis chaperone n=1 Tax=unclassified Agrobacterium TaxID=2632611 RepID=UPI002447835D|nr:MULTISPECIES: molecular chaperone [unclassified Agrobacterium]MDH0616515.1 molecular chaperone [Agrobacterium sp. GD03872]MDH0699183.1 molecular chaperone [Agrobacterium sp. GD03871]MDH1061833.1 molecular chaperone [Agrobacterium sp. GD03992]MDH2213455.1 molecular chaperone [Agrobacterium sp. GD03643]MDH2222199.1 molecular chaperone [Agrobacterium sp. GD03638]
MRVFTLAAAFFAGLSVSPSQAASLRVAPVLLDIKAPTAASSLRIWNDAKTPINVQVRIFRWTQQNGQDVYTAAQDVVASPPMTQLKGGAENLIRIVRLSKAPLRAEESYRVIVDELPPAGKPQSGTVNLVVRHSIPVFFSPASTGDAQPVWKVTPQGKGYRVSVSNAGDRRIRIANLMLSGGGQPIARQQGLVGYVLGKSAASFLVPATGGRAGGTLKISADSEGGPVNATARVSGG